MQLCIIQTPDYQNTYSNCTVNVFQKCSGESGDTLPSSPSRILNLLLWSRPDAIINARDPAESGLNQLNPDKK